MAAFRSPTYQGNYQSILGGVSQQVYTDRQPSQVEVQTNMSSDTVHGLRKRPGTRLTLDLDNAETKWWSLGNYGHLRTYTTNLGWGVTEFIVNTVTGCVISIVETETVQYIGQYPYLVSSNPADIVFTTVGSTLYIGNTSVKPVVETDETRVDPALRGYFFVLAGSYGRVYSVTIKTATGTYTASYETPDGTSAGDSELATGEYIIGQLGTQLIAQIGGATGLTSVVEDGAYMYLEIDDASGYLNVSTGTGSTYAIASNTHTVDLTTKLPAKMPDAADGFIMSVGDTSFYQYFEWVASQTRWIETGVFGSPTAITGSTMPLVVTAAGTTNQHAISEGVWPGREAGDDDTNQIPAFTADGLDGITGLASFQGRLIIFSGPYITMGNSYRDDRQNFFRTTVTETLDNDRIEFTATSFAGAKFKYGVPFNSDLILASEEHQGVIPGRSQVLTPSNATAVLTSTYQMDMVCEPRTSGRSLYYAYPRSSSSFSVKEMLPSGYTDLQYVSQDVTDHLPTYLEGGARYIAASTTNNIVVMGSTTEQSTLYVNEYLWSGDQKVLSSWHKWDMYGTVHAAWFVREVLMLLVEQDGHMSLATLSLRDIPDPSDPARFLPALDNCRVMTPVSLDATYDNQYLDFSTGYLSGTLWSIIVSRYETDGNLDFLAAVVPDGNYIGASVGIKSIDLDAMRVYLQPTYGSSTLVVGTKFTMQFSPTPPRIFNQDGTYMDVDKLVVMHYNMTFRYTSPFTITAQDRGGYVVQDAEGSPTRYTSQELGLLTAPLAKRAHVKFRVGMEAESSSILFESTTPGDFNLQGMGYIVKFNNKVRRI